ncbi:MAG TPA: hypothetical protein VKE27_10120 [Candidatus Dormibacteraeota bacterium]|nr:hypothetical protein [Candidatus Dormibacteraeota bacterium]
MRIPAIVIGFALVLVAFTAASRVADTHEGLVAEVVTLLAGLAAVGLLMYGLVARARPSPTSKAVRPATPPRPRTRRDLLLGAGGVLLALVLVTGLAWSGGPLWAALGFVLLLPMLAGCVYLCVRFVRATP